MKQYNILFKYIKKKFVSFFFLMLIFNVYRYIYSSDIFGDFIKTKTNIKITKIHKNIIFIII